MTGFSLLENYTDNPERLVRRVLVFCNVTNKIRKRTDTAITFTQEYSRVSYPLRNMSTLSTGSGCPRTHTHWCRKDRIERTKI